MTDRLYRSLDDRIVAGVAGGLADYWGTDPSWIRVIWVVLAIISGGLALVVYIVMAIVVPQEDVVMTAAAPPPVQGAPADLAGASIVPPTTRAAWRAERRAQRQARRAARGPGSFGMVVGAGLILIGIWYLVKEYFPGFDADRLWPFALVALGVALLVGAMARRPREPGGAG
jgi:phage shock protein C